MATIIGTFFNDRLIGTFFADTIRGLASSDFLDGRGGNRLDGGPGHDTLTGRGGADTFVINNPGEAGDTIADFRPGVDHIEIGRAGFGLGSLPAGTLSGANFATGPATTPQQHFLYSPGTGNLSFDADGNGGGGAVLVTHLNVTGFTAGDILLA